MKSDPNLKSLCSELKESDFSLMIFLLTSVSSTSSSSRLSILSSWGLAGTKTRLSLLLIRLCLVSFRPIFPRLYFFLRLRVSDVITSDSKMIKIQVSDSLLYLHRPRSRCRQRQTFCGKSFAGWRSFLHTVM